MSVPQGARALLRGLVDYAGLFPPAAEPMELALRHYAAYRRGPEAWMLGRFICPAARLDEFAAAVQPYLPDAAGEWRLSVLLGLDAEADVARLTALNAAHMGVLCDAVEARASDEAAIARLARATRAAGLPCYVELPVADDPAALISAVGAAGLRAKIRTGGVTADAFPTAAQVARFLGACLRHEVPCKATAGLHHPLRGEYRLTYDAASAQGTMFGFLNVLLAAAWLRDGATEADTVALLEEREASAFRFTESGVQWRELLFLHARLERLRSRAFIAVGSCSFTEPVHELAGVPGWTTS